MLDLVDKETIKVDAIENGDGPISLNIKEGQEQILRGRVYYYNVNLGTDFTRGAIVLHTHSVDEKTTKDKNGYTDDELLRLSEVVLKSQKPEFAEIELPQEVKPYTGFLHEPNMLKVFDKLLDVVTKAAKEDGLKFVECLVPPNSRYRSLLQKHGFYHLAFSTEEAINKYGPNSGRYQDERHLMRFKIPE